MDRVWDTNCTNKKTIVPTAYDIEREKERIKRKSNRNTFLQDLYLNGRVWVSNCTNKKTIVPTAYDRSRERKKE